MSNDKAKAAQYRQSEAGRQAARIRRMNPEVKMKAAIKRQIKKRLK